MASKNVWDEYYASGTKMVKNNIAFTQKAAEKIQEVMQSGSKICTELFEETTKLDNIEGPLHAGSKAFESMAPIGQKTMKMSKNHHDVACDIAKDATHLIEKNAIEAGQSMNCLIDEHLSSEHMEMAKTTGKQAISAWLESVTWMMANTRQAINVSHAMFHAAAAPAEATAPTAKK